MFLNSVWCLVGCMIKKGFFLLLLFLNSEGLQANHEDADPMMVGFVSWSWGYLVVHDVIEECGVAELMKGRYVCPQLQEESPEGDLSGGLGGLLV